MAGMTPTPRQNLEIRPSPIAGSGVFAKVEIKKGETITFLEGETCTLDEIVRRVKAGLEEPSDPLQIEDVTYLDLEEFSRTFNHSCEPNAYIRGQNELVALRNIASGEEVAYDYSATMNDNQEKIEAAGRHLWTCECHCGSQKCRGIINQFKTLPEETRRRYLDEGLVTNFVMKSFGP